MESWDLRPKKFQTSVAVPPAPVRVPSQRPIAPSVASVTSDANDKDDILGARDDCLVVQCDIQFTTLLLHGSSVMCGLAVIANYHHSGELYAVTLFKSSHLFVHK